MINVIIISFIFIQGDSGGPLICVVSDRATLVGENSEFAKILTPKRHSTHDYV